MPCNAVQDFWFKDKDIVLLVVFEMSETDSERHLNLILIIHIRHLSVVKWPIFFLIITKQTDPLRIFINYCNPNMS